MKRIRPDLADDVSYIAAHENDPRKEEVLYEAVEALEALIPAASEANDKITVLFVCGDPAIFIKGKRIAKLSASTEEGRILSEWARARWDGERGEGIEGRAEKSA